MLNAYRFLVCLILAFYIHPLLNYIFNSVPIPESTSVWAVVLVCLFFLERLYISFKLEMTH